MKHVAIIGGGFGDDGQAVNLARLSAAGPLKITIVNQGYPLGRGIAYSTRNVNHLLNVAARKMSALADQPTHFVEWLRTRSEFYDEPVARCREKFMPRPDLWRLSERPAVLAYLRGGGEEYPY